jgi:hypothetical protein
VLTAQLNNLQTERHTVLAKFNSLMQYVEMISVYLENPTKPITTLSRNMLSVLIQIANMVNIAFERINN